MKQQKLFPIKIDQELIDTYYAYKKEIKKLNKYINKANDEIFKYEKIKSEVGHHKLTNESLSFLKYKKVYLCESLVDLYKTDCCKWNSQLEHRKSWLSDFEDFIQELEAECQKRNYLYAI
mgnify:CR=1 FL=1|jgi:hypothetical protein